VGVFLKASNLHPLLSHPTHLSFMRRSSLKCLAGRKPNSSRSLVLAGSLYILSKGTCQFYQTT
jgi:hypothetical protein